MPRNVLDVGAQTFAVILGIIVLLGAALAFSFRHRSDAQAGASGHRPDEQQDRSELVGPDGYIDSFAGIIEEAGGGLPRVGKAIIAVIAVSYFAYLALYWTPR